MIFIRILYKNNIVDKLLFEKRQCDSQKFCIFAIDMKKSVIWRFVVMGILWLLLVAVVVVRTPRITLYTIFAIIASAIIIFVPLYKKYVKNGGK